MAANNKEEPEVKGEQHVYSKNQFLSGKDYKAERDLLSVLLEDGKTYTKKQVNDLIKQYNKKEVK